VNNNLLAQLPISCSTALLMGIVAGMGQCGVACAPFLSTYIMGSGEGALNGLKSFMVFAVGKVFICAVLGLAVGCLGTAFTSMDTRFRYVSTAFGAGMIIIGLLMIIRPVRVSCRKSNKEIEETGLFLRTFAFNPTSHLFIMGMVCGAIPCPPMGAVLLYSLQMPSPVLSCAVMALFAVGSAVSPLIIISAVAGWFSKKIKAEASQYRMMFQRISGLILILLGGFSAISGGGLQ